MAVWYINGSGGWVQRSDVQQRGRTRWRRLLSFEEKGYRTPLGWTLAAGEFRQLDEASLATKCTPRLPTATCYVLVSGTNYHVSFITQADISAR